MYSMKNSGRRRLMNSAMSLALATFGAHGVAHAQAGGASDPPAAAAAQMTEVVVTGSRIRRSTDTTSPAPVAVVGQQSLDDQGFTQVGQALNQIPSIAPMQTYNKAPLSNGQALSGQQFPNLFNLGPARTLSLLNGHRMVASTSGLGDEAVDTNILPTKLLDRIDVVQGGGAAVYGSGAIAGVVNYVLKDHYQGQEIQAQYGESSRGDNRTHSLNAIVGADIQGGRGNIAAEFDYSKSSPVLTYQRPDTTMTMGVAPNPVVGAGTNGIPVSIYIPGLPQPGGRVPFEDPRGLVVISPSGFTIANVLKANGQGLTFDGSGNLVPAGLGTPVFGAPQFTLGSDLDYATARLTPLISGVERKVGTLIGHYDLTDHVKLSGELLAANTTALNPQGNVLYSQFTGALAGTYPALAPFAFTKTNPYLSAATIAQLSAANPAFAAGGPLYLSKILNVGSSYLDQRFTTKTLQALASLDGDFNAADRQFYWGVSFSAGRVRSSVDGYNVVAAHVRNAVNAVRNGAGQIVCAINSSVVVDPSCVPINIFGATQITDPAALSYLYAKSGAATGATAGNVLNKQQDFLATLGGDLIKLPGGQSKFSVSYEYRHEDATFTPTAGDQAGIFFTAKQIPGAGAFHTNELAGELDVPILGGDFSLPLVKALDLSGSFRRVDNSLAGANNAWSLGGRWDVGYGLTLRATTSHNFRAPSIGQVLAPPSVNIGGGKSPCSRTLITTGPSPSVRAANCLALFTANPTFGLSSLPAGTANTPANRLKTFTATPISAVVTTTTGNSDLTNETAKTTTVGFVYEPPFVPGLALSADVIRVHLGNALTLFSVQNYADSCFDAAPQPATFCQTLGYNSAGDIVSGISSTVNAGSAEFHAETYNIDYHFSLSAISETLPGSMTLVLQATHNTLQTVTFAGTTTRTDGTIALPSWATRFNAHYTNGPLRLSYSVNYLPPSLLAHTSTVTNSPSGIYRVDRNIRQDVSAEYTFARKYTVRAGVNNFTNELPSFPTATYGDIIGRAFFVSVDAKF